MFLGYYLCANMAPFIVCIVSAAACCLKKTLSHWTISFKFVEGILYLNPAHLESYFYLLVRNMRTAWRTFDRGKTSIMIHSICGFSTALVCLLWFQNVLQILICKIYDFLCQVAGPGFLCSLRHFGHLSHNKNSVYDWKITEKINPE